MQINREGRGIVRRSHRRASAPYGTFYSSPQRHYRAHIPQHGLSGMIKVSGCKLNERL